MQSSAGSHQGFRGPVSVDLAERARRLGPLPHSALGMAGPDPAGPTASEVARWEAETIDRLWRSTGRPDPFTVVEVGAGDGSVAVELLSGPTRPACSEALRLVLVENDDALRERQALRLPVESPALILGPLQVPTDPDEDPRPVEGIGPRVASLAELPMVQGPCAVVASGWLSRMPFDLFEWRGDRWYDVRVTWGEADELREITVELDPDRAQHLSRLVSAGSRIQGSRYAGQEAGAVWLRQALATTSSGWVVVADHWSEHTVPVLGTGAPPVALDQLVLAHRSDTGIEDGGPGGMGCVRWRIG